MEEHMKIALLTPMKFVAAIIVGIVLAIAVASITAPHPVETPPIVITPAPTPAPVYTEQHIPQDQWGDEELPGLAEIAYILPIVIIGVAIMTIVFGLFTVTRY